MQIPSALASRGLQLLQYRSLLREAGTEPGRSTLCSQIISVAKNFRGQAGARRRIESPPREAVSGSAVDSLVVSVSARPTRAAAVASRALTRRIVRAALPVASATPSAIASRRALAQTVVRAGLPAAALPAAASPGASSGLFVSSGSSSPFPPVAHHEGDATMSGGLPVLLSPAAAAVVWPPSPPVVPAAPPVTTPTTVLLDQLLQKAQRLGVVAGGISDSLRALVGFFFSLSYRFIPANRAYSLPARL